MPLFLSYNKAIINHQETIKGVLVSSSEQPEHKVWFGLVWFYSISTSVGYLVPNPFLYM